MLSGKQKRYLRALASKEKSLFQIGKEGLSTNLFDSIKNALKARELVKINVLKTCELEMNEIIIDVLANTNAELVQKIGKTIVLYKPSKEHLIILP